MTVDSTVKFLLDTEKHIENTYSFYNFGSKSILTGIVTGDGDNFCCRIVKFYSNRLAKETFEIFGCRFGIWEM